jgi:hypothetical protein
MAKKKTPKKGLTPKQEKNLPSGLKKAMKKKMGIK